MPRTPSQIGRSNRNRGYRFQREVARWLTEKTGYAWSSVRNSGATHIVGDVYCSERPIDAVSVETKNDADFNCEQMVSPTKRFNEKVEKMVSDAGGRHLVVIARNRHGWWVFESARSDWFVCDASIRTEHGEWRRLVGVTEHFIRFMAGHGATGEG